MLQSLIGPIANLAGTFLKNKAAEKQAVHESKLRRITNDGDWETQQAAASQTSWKDEWLTLLLSGPFILSFCGDWGREMAAEGFAALDLAPSWYSYSLGVVIAASFGIKSATKFFGGKK